MLTDFAPPSGVELDHLGVQLSALGAILAELAPTADSDAAAAIEQLASSFFRDHLTWPNLLIERAAERAQSDFYKKTLALTADLLASWRASDAVG